MTSSKEPQRITTALHLWFWTCTPDPNHTLRERRFFITVLVIEARTTSGEYSRAQPKVLRDSTLRFQV